MRRKRIKGQNVWSHIKIGKRYTKGGVKLKNGKIMWRWKAPNRKVFDIFY